MLSLVEKLDWFVFPMLCLYGLVKLSPAILRHSRSYLNWFSLFVYCLYGGNGVVGRYFTKCV